MARTRNAVNRQKLESALFNPDVVFLLAALLDAQDLRQVSLTCKALGAKQAAACGGLSLVEEAARRLFECASEWERSCLPKRDDEGWIELYRHLLMLRSKLTFDQLVGDYIRYGDDESTVCLDSCFDISSALCSEHKMRSGRHYAVFTMTTGVAYIGVIRPVQIDRADLEDGGWNNFSPHNQRFLGTSEGQENGQMG